jgi:predicted membrane protein
METTPYFCSKHRQMKKIIFGLILISAGVLLILFNAGMIDPMYRHIIFSWPMILISIGIMNLFSKESVFSGIVLLLVGGFFLLPHFLLLPGNFTHNFWPGLLVIVGIMIILRRTIFRSHYQHKFEHHFGKHSTSEMTNESGFIVINNIFSGGKHKVPPTEFKGGKISNIFGGTELDLTQASLAPGVNVLEVSCIFGGANIIVPSDWVVKLQMNSILGGFSDKRPNIKNPEVVSARELVIKGSTIFGGGDVKCY